MGILEKINSGFLASLPRSFGYRKTLEFIGKEYVRNKGKFLKVGDRVLVHPTEKSQSRAPYEAKIISEYWEWWMEAQLKFARMWQEGTRQ